MLLEIKDHVILNQVGIPIPDIEIRSSDDFHDIESGDILDLLEQSAIKKLLRRS